MRIAIAVSGRDTATTLDFAHELEVVQVKSAEIVKRTREQFNRADDSGRIRQLLSHGIDVLICGAVSRPIVAALENSRIHIFPLVSGPVDDILSAFMTDQLSDPKYLMAGCTAEDRAKLVGRSVCSVR